GNESEQYARRLEVLVNQWREAFAQPLLPFYFVQIAPYLYGNALATDAAYLREQQMIAAANIKNSSLVCTNDLVYPQEENQIHPSQKQQIGERLAFTALARDYGYDNIMYKSPSLGELTIQNDTCIVRLKDTYHGVKQQKEYTGFDIAGEDKIYYPAKATYKGNDIFILSSPQVLHPKAVRYCYRNFQLGNVANMAGLPLFPFSMNSNAAP
ncbi:MAG: sialate O-acetylesterase, partial [Hoylesella buccalis]